MKNWKYKPVLSYVDTIFHSLIIFHKMSNKIFSFEVMKLNQSIANELLKPNGIFKTA